MIIGKVIGVIRADRRERSLQGQNFLAVQAEGQLLAAANLVGAATGDRVLLVTGPAAARFSMEAPVDAAVVAIADGEE